MRGDEGTASRRRIGLFRLGGQDGKAAAVADVEAADPVNDVLGYVGSVVRDAFEVARGKNELHARSHESGLLSHVLKQLFEKALSILIDDIIAFENLGGHFYVTENECAKALADHGANGRGHGGQLFGNLSALHLAEGNDALGDVHREVADALEVIRDF